jgi:PhzF family phenazine biosynthesis protein
MIIHVHILSSFAKISGGGNSAGVVLNAHQLTEQQMQQIAKEVGLSETAFVQESDQADFKIRFFTPNGEVDLCGHATIACFSLMFNLELILAGKFTQETKAGILEIEIKSDGTIFMEQNIPEFYEEIDRCEVAASLNVSMEILDSNLPVQIVSTGLRDIIVPVKGIRELDAIQPDFKKVAAVSEKYGVVGYHLFSTETKFNSTAYCRNLAPLYNIPEESATGTSNGALSCYLFKYRKIDKMEAKSLVFEQGYSMGKPSEILVVLETDRKEILGVKVGGRASCIQTLEIEV